MALFASPPPVNPLVGSNPLQDLLAGFTTGSNLARLPQQQEQAALQAQLAAALNQAKLAQIQDALANPNREFENAIKLQAAQAANARALETLKENKPFFSENLGKDLYRDENGILRGRLVPIDGTGETALPSGLFQGAAPNLGAPEAPALTFEQPPAQDLNSQLQQIVTGSVPPAPSTLVGRLAQEEAARLTREEVARKATAEQKDIDRNLKTSERVAHETFLEGLNDKKLKADIEKAKAKTTGGIKPTGEESRAFRNTVNVFSTLSEVEKKADELAKTGKYPGGVQTFINQFLTSRPDDIPGSKLIPGASAIYAVAQQRLRDAQTPESRQLEAMRAELTANIIRAQAGLSQTSGEIANVTPYTPQASDNIDSLRDKLVNLRRLAERDLKSFGLVYPAFREIEIPGYNAQTSGNPDVPVITVPTRNSGASKSGNKFELAQPPQ